MGDWTITIAGQGAHHNDKPAGDADAIATQTVRELIEAGQDVTLANFDTGSGRTDLLQRIKEQDQPEAEAETVAETSTASSVENVAVVPADGGDEAA